MTTSASYIALVLAVFTAIQGPCPDQGSRFVARQVDSGPRLGGQSPTSHPAWQLDTPAHREPLARRGFYPGKVRDIPRRLIRYRQTRLWSRPILVAQTLRLDFVYDITAHRCL